MIRLPSVVLVITAVKVIISCSPGARLPGPIFQYKYCPATKGAFGVMDDMKFRFAGRVSHTAILEALPVPSFLIVIEYFITAPAAGSLPDAVIFIVRSTGEPGGVMVMVGVGGIGVEVGVGVFVRVLVDVAV